jgi:hypothetical protein
MEKHDRHLRVFGQGEVEVEFVAAYLMDLKYAYDSIFVFEAVIDGLRRSAREFPFPSYQYALASGWPVASRRGVRHLRDWPPAPDQIASLVPNSDRLILTGVRLASPGFWDFLGKLNPLEVLRQYLNDRHERRKDYKYRESAEERRLLLENLERENRVIAERIRIARDLGATTSDLAPLLNDLIYKPLVTLGRHQDQGVIEGARIMRLGDERGSRLQ